MTKVLSFSILVLVSVSLKAEDGILCKEKANTILSKFKLTNKVFQLSEPLYNSNEVNSTY